MIIAAAIAADATRLTQIMRQSKAYWGYSAAQLKAWESELLISEAHIIDYIVFKLIIGGKVLGFYSLLPRDGQQIWMENLFIHPSLIGKGYGSSLLQHAVEESKKRGFQEMGLEADPNAVSFYLRKGFSVIGQTPTSIPGRFMPLMSKLI